VLLCEILAVYRILDIVSYRIFFLMVKSQEEPWRPEILRRSLAIAVVNFTELIFGFAILYLYCGCIRTGTLDAALSRGADALYYSVVTMTTLGYGDFVPSSVGGRMLVVGQLATTITFLLFLVPALISVFASRLTPDGENSHPIN
jgi:voltage-gated potassium channel Kch